MHAHMPQHAAACRRAPHKPFGCRAKPSAHWVQRSLLEQAVQLPGQVSAVGGGGHDVQWASL